MAGIYAPGQTGNEAVAYEDPNIDYPMVKSGFLYYVYVNVGQNARVHGVKVVYE